MADNPVPAVMASTVLLLRDNDGSPDPLEVFMVVRHHQIDFASGALVFPGGKLAKGDRDSSVRAFCVGADLLDDDMLGLRVGALREVFEECGVLLAYDEAGAMVAGDRLESLDHYRKPLDRGEIGIVEMLTNENLKLAVDQMVPFAHWITPVFMPKRFDTHFFVVKAPSDQVAQHDGREMVDSVWINPKQALQSAEEGIYTIIFPTRMNLKKLGAYDSVDSALNGAKGQVPFTVEPWTEGEGDKAVLRIPAEAGYGVTEIPLSRMMS